MVETVQKKSVLPIEQAVADILPLIAIGFLMRWGFFLVNEGEAGLRFADHGLWNQGGAAAKYGTAAGPAVTVAVEAMLKAVMKVVEAIMIPQSHQQLIYFSLSTLNQYAGITGENYKQGLESEPFCSADHGGVSEHNDFLLYREYKGPSVEHFPYPTAAGPKRHEANSFPLVHPKRNLKHRGETSDWTVDALCSSQMPKIWVS